MQSPFPYRKSLLLDLVTIQRYYHVRWETGYRYFKELLGFTNINCFHLISGDLVSDAELFGITAARLDEGRNYAWRCGVPNSAGVFRANHHLRLPASLGEKVLFDILKHVKLSA